MGIIFFLIVAVPAVIIIAKALKAMNRTNLERGEDG